MHGRGVRRFAVEVDFFAGFRASERPLRFRLGESVLEVEEVLAEWRTPDEICFQVRAGGRLWLLRGDLVLDSWTAEPREAAR